MIEERKEQEGRRGCCSHSIDCSHVKKESEKKKGVAHVCKNHKLGSGCLFMRRAHTYVFTPRSYPYRKGVNFSALIIKHNQCRSHHTGMIAYNHIHLAHLN